MKNEINLPEIDFYRENGFLAIENFLNADELAQWQQCFDESVSERLSGDVELMTNQRDPQHYFARTFIQCLRVSDTHAGIKRLIQDPRLGKMAGLLAGVGGVRIWHDQVLIKPPHGNPTAWHLDAPYWSFDSRDALSFWLALDDTTLQNGAMAYLPGTHKTARLDKNVRGAVNVGELFDLYPEWREIDPVCLPVPAGSLIWHNGLTAHAAGANLTPQHRRALTCIFMPDGCKFNGKRNASIPEDYYNSLEIGDVFNNDIHNPLTWNTDMCWV